MSGGGTPLTHLIGWEIPLLRAQRNILSKGKNKLSCWRYKSLTKEIKKQYISKQGYLRPQTNGQRNIDINKHRLKSDQRSFWHPTIFSFTQTLLEYKEFRQKENTRKEQSPSSGITYIRGKQTLFLLGIR